MLLKNGLIYFHGTFRRLDIRVEEGLIADVGEDLPESGDVLDCRGRLVIPGLIDIHTHGCMGYDFSTADTGEIRTMLDYYQKNGITSVCATTITMPPDPYRKAVRTIRDCMEPSADSRSAYQFGSRILGINMDGPYLAPSKKGAHDEQYLTPVNEALFTELDELSGGNIKIVDVAPEIDGAMRFIKAYGSKKIISIAHTSCDYNTAIEAVKNGASHITHLFNAMNPLHHRDPGVIGALSDSDIRAEIICDGVHIHPAVIRMMFRLCPEKMVLISDSISACGLSDGSYVLGGLDVTVSGGKAVLEDGTIAGSACNVYEDLKKVVSFGVPLEAAVKSATLLPARVLGMDDRLGSIDLGKYADLLVTDMSLNLEKVYQSGVSVSG